MLNDETREIYEEKTTASGEVESDGLVGIVNVIVNARIGIVNVNAGIGIVNDGFGCGAIVKGTANENAGTVEIVNEAFGIGNETLEIGDEILVSRHEILES